MASCATCRQDSDGEKLLYENRHASGETDHRRQRPRSPAAGPGPAGARARDDRSGEADFYQAVLIARRDGQASDCERITRLLERSAERRYPLANAMLYKIYAEPFLLPRADIPKAETYRQAYAERAGRAQRLPLLRASPAGGRSPTPRRLRPDPSGPNPGPATVPVVRPKHHFCR
ncbi:hypothetical protein ACPA9J_08425 [Pseudomonas aeruginosa]